MSSTRRFAIRERYLPVSPTSPRENVVLMSDRVTPSSRYPLASSTDPMKQKSRILRRKTTSARRASSPPPTARTHSPASPASKPRRCVSPYPPSPSHTPQLLILTPLPDNGRIRRRARRPPRREPLLRRRKPRETRYPVARAPTIRTAHEPQHVPTNPSPRGRETAVLRPQRLVRHCLLWWPERTGCVSPCGSPVAARRERPRSRCARASSRGRG